MALARLAAGVADGARAESRRTCRPRPEANERECPGQNGQRAPEQERQTGRCSRRAGPGPWR
eukprot:12983279-Alexandrium_andersonii.AAC.1